MSTDTSKLSLKLPKAMYVAKMFYNLPAIKVAVAEAKEERKSKNQNVWEKASGTSNPTERLALLSEEPILYVELENGLVVMQPEDWIMVIENTLYHFKKQAPILKEFIQMWLDNVPAHTIRHDLAINTTTYYNIKHAIINYAVALAAQYRLIKIKTDF